MHVNIPCEFILNGEFRVAGRVCIQTTTETWLVIAADEVLPHGPISMTIGRDDCADIAAFFQDADMCYWKVTITNPESPYQNVICVIGFARDSSGFTLHVSFDFGDEKKHIETPIAAADLMFFQEVWM